MNKNRKLINNLKSQRIEFSSGWVSVVIISIIVVVLGLNLFRVIINARNSLEVESFERESLASLLEENEELKQELEYYNSYEYKKLYARDNLRLGEPNERLFRILGAPSYYTKEEEQIELIEEGKYASWWLELL